MEIVNHRLVGVPYEPDDHGGPLTPQIVVVHYAVTLTARSTAVVLKARDYVSCHVSIGDGVVIQQVSFDRVAWHAGKSSYQGRDDVNKFSIGIEIANPGPLVERSKNYYPTWPNAAPWAGGVHRGRHKNDTGHTGWVYWAEYSERDIDMVIHLCDLLRDRYGITDIVGHDDVSPGRKQDPGPAFPLEAVRDAVFPSRRTA